MCFFYVTVQNLLGHQVLTVRTKVFSQTYWVFKYAMKFLFEKKQGLCLLRRIMAETGDELHTICNKKKSHCSMLICHIKLFVVKLKDGVECLKTKVLMTYFTNI